MIKKEWIPSDLLKQRPPVEIMEPSRPSRMRGLSVIRLLIGLFFRVWWDQRRGRSDTSGVGERLKTACEELGGMWIKVGQFISMRTDLFDPDMCAVLGQLQDSAPGFAFSYTKNTIETDLQAPLENLYSEFDERPFTADSIGQIHRAVLRSNGVEVAVKIRRPYIGEVMTQDVRIIRLVVMLANRLGIMPQFRWSDFYSELKRKLDKQLDFRFEGNSIRRLRRNFKRHKKMYAPHVYKKMVSARVMTMEFVRGVLLADIIRLRKTDPKAVDRWLEDNDIAPKTVANQLYASHLRQRFMDNLFHGDLDPGNIVLLRNSRVCLIDFVEVDTLDDELRMQFGEFQEALVFGEFAKVIDLFLLMPPDLPLMDLELVRTELLRTLTAWELRAQTKGLPLSDKSTVSLFGEMSRIVTRYRIPLPWSLLRVNRSTLTLDESLRELHPEMNYFKVMRSYYLKTEREVQRRTLRTLGKGVDLAEIITQLSESVHRTREEGWYKLEWMRRRARSFQAIPTKLAYGLAAVINLFGWAANFGALFVVGLYSHQHLGGRFIPDGFTMLYEPIPTISKPAWFLIGIGSTVILLQTLRVRARFLQPDIELPGRRH